MIGDVVPDATKFDGYDGSLDLGAQCRWKFLGEALAGNPSL